MHDLLAVTSDEGDGQRKPLIELVINVTSLTRPIAPVTCNLGVSSRERPPREASSLRPWQ